MQIHRNGSSVPYYRTRSIPAPARIWEECGNEFSGHGNMEFLHQPFARNIKEGDRVLIISDTSHDPRVWQVVQSICSRLGAEVTVALFERRPADYYDPPSAVCEAMMKSNVNVLLASTGMLHSPANFRAMQAGIPAICLDGGMTLEMLQSGAITDDMRQIAVRKHYVAKDVFGADAKTCRVTSRYGTDFTYSVEGRVCVPPLPGNSFDPYKIINFDKDENRKGGNLLLLSVPDRRNERGAGRRQRQRQARHRSHHASHRSSRLADRADVEKAASQDRRRPRRSHPARLPDRLR